MLTLHIANKNYSSWSMRPWLLMRELGIPFVEQLHWFAPTPGANAKAFAAFSPNRKVPCLHDGDLRIADSLAITEHLAEQHAAVWPADRKARAWARMGAAEMHSSFVAIRNTYSMNCGLRITIANPPAAASAELQRLVELWQQGLTDFGGPFLAGAAFTAVDAFFAPVVFRAQTFGWQLPPDCAAYVAMMLARPSMEQWYREALAETVRDPAHDLYPDATITADLRAAPSA